MSLARQRVVEDLCAEHGAVPFAIALLANAIEHGYVDAAEVAHAMLSGGLDLYLSRCMTIHAATGDDAAVAQLSDISATLRAARTA